TLYEIWGHPDAQVQAQVLPQADGDIVVEFRIEEGEPLIVAGLQVTGAGTLDPPLVLPSRLPLAEGGTYALPKLEATQLYLRQAMAERGHPHAEVEVAGRVDDAAHSAWLELRLQPGPRARFG